MKRPEQREGESELSYGYRLALWFSDPTRLVLRAIANQELSADGKTFKIRQPRCYVSCSPKK